MSLIVAALAGALVMSPTLQAQPATAAGGAAASSGGTVMASAPAQGRGLHASLMAKRSKSTTKVRGWSGAQVTGQPGQVIETKVRVAGSKRKVRTQKSVNGRWRTVKTFRENKSGVARVKMSIGTAPVSWRLVVPAKGRYKRVVTSTKVLVPTTTATDSTGTTTAAPATATAVPPAYQQTSLSIGPTGAQLPVSYQLSSLSGTVLFVAPGGSDSASGSVSAPLGSLAAAVAKVGSGQSATVVVRGGTYRQGNVSIPSGRKVRIVAYPGEVPVFTGARVLSSWVAEGSLSYHPYTAQPVTNGSGISFTTGQNLTGDGVGKFPDQAWVGSTQLRQVTSKSAVTAGRFWVDAANSRIYLAGTDAGTGAVEASDRDVFISISGAGSSLEGVRITRYSPSANDYGAIGVNPGAHGTVMRHVEITEAAFQAVQYAGSSPIQGALMENVTVARSNWMGVSSTLVDNLTMRSVLLTEMNQFGEFTHSPQSGALKTSRNRAVKVLDSVVTNNNSHGLWFDQSNVDVDVVGNTVTGNLGSAVFFEISDDLLMVDNYVRSTGGARALKIAGASGVKLVNNTIVGGADPIGVYVDVRSKPGCADPSQPLCANSYNSDRDTARPIPATLDWMPRIDLMLNNIIAHPTATGYCGTTTALCITAANGTATAPIQTVIHQADPTRGIPQTRIDGNVYTNGSATTVATAIGKYTTHTAFGTAMAGTPVTITGIDANAKTGTTWTNPDGTPTAALTAAHNQAVPIPTDTNINQYLAPGTRHYGHFN
jgi:hypothetical protein